MEQKYSVLMSVYGKEKPEYLKAAMESMLYQTVPADDFVLVCDGPLHAELYQVIEEQKKRFQDVLHIIRLERNCGLGNALNEGMKHCRHELIARMDSDDISFSDRCEKQLKIFQDRPDIGICSGTVLEFQGTPDHITGKRVLPREHETICKFSHKRNPFNHPAVMFCKSAVEESGGYQERYHLFEDYELWVRMLMKGYRGYNLDASILYMRTSKDMYIRRGGWNYAKTMLKFHGWMKKCRWISTKEYITGAIPHGVVCIMPSGIRSQIYRKIHDKKERSQKGGLYENKCSAGSYPE